MTKSYDCKGCTNICHMIYNGETATYCRGYYDRLLRRKWFGDELRCLSYTTDPEAEDKQVRMWQPPKKAKRG